MYDDACGIKAGMGFWLACNIWAHEQSVLKGGHVTLVPPGGHCQDHI